MKKSILMLTLLSAISYNACSDTLAAKKALDDENVTLAEQVFNELSSSERVSIEGQVITGRILLAKDKTEEAFEHFEELSEQYSDNIDVHYYLGLSAVIMAQKASIFSKLGYAEDFIEAMEKTIQLNPQHLDALNTLIGFHLAAPGIAGGDQDKALALAKQIKSFNQEQGYAQLTNVYWRTEQKELAEQAFAEGIKQFPHSYSLYLNRAMASFRAEDWQKANTDLLKAVEYATTDSERSQALYQQGKVSVESGKGIIFGIEALNQALPIADTKHQPWIKYRLAQLYTLNKEINKAKELVATINLSKNEDLEDKVKKLTKKLKKLHS
ncbi:hypothetical protein tinsulaeT_13830 [Thalassotalea insulae]|uniref:Tetratricopeptide repeat protein n=1 Tax=Thalassotalea insulae TaxID=2056778 RepID=A0ABQ6GPZ3_9GAMM|nr:hypothetical protein [Thalassotalea insulae]GLX78043.1 hypothetical protein tinsulaeT_13830 [Thalassotalea insulae]